MGPGGCEAPNRPMLGGWMCAIERPASGFLKVFATCLLAGCLVVFATYASALSVLSVKGSFATDAVDVGVTSTLPEGSVLEPGSTVPSVFTITGDGADCFIRCKVEYAAPGSAESGFTESASGADKGACEGAEDLSEFLDPELWVFADDGFAYCRQKLVRGGELSFSLDVADRFDGAVASFEQELTVEAVQARNFVPDFSSAEPWGNIPIEQESGRTVAMRQGSGNPNYSVSYTGAGGFSVTDGDFFSHFGMLMPGDVCSGSVLLSNEGPQDAVMHLGVSFPSEDGAGGLYDQAVLSVYAPGSSSDGSYRLLFEGPLSRASLENRILLGCFAPGETRELRFVLELPESLGNEAAARVGEAVFRFEAEGASGGQASSGGTDGNGTGEASSGEGAPIEGPDSPQANASSEGEASQGSADGQSPASSLADSGRDGDASGAAEGKQGSGVAARMLAKTADFVRPVLPALVAVAAVSTCIAAASVLYANSKRSR